MTDRLIETIGLAPSEQSLEEFMERLKEERRRVARGLEARRISSLPKPKKPRKASAKKKSKKKAEAQMAIDFKKAMEEKAKKEGKSLEEFLK